MNAMFIHRAVIGVAILSTTAALGCVITSYPDNDEDRNERLAAAKAAQYPPCGPEMPFSLAMDTDDPSLHLPQQPYVADYSYQDTFPATVVITWGDLPFIALNLNSEFPEDGKGQFFVDGTLRIDLSRGAIWTIAPDSILIMDEKTSKFYLKLQGLGSLWGVLCDNRTTK